MRKGPGKTSSLPIVDRIKLNVVETPEGCWEWQGAKSGGYGIIAVKVHKLAYELLVGPVPAGLVLDHEKCDNPACCNPEHLVIATFAQNMFRSRGTHCSRGHRWTEKTEYWYTRRDGQTVRMCRVCRRRYHRARQRARAKKRGGPGYGPKPA